MPQASCPCMFAAQSGCWWTSWCFWWWRLLQDVQCWSTGPDGCPSSGALEQSSGGSPLPGAPPADSDTNRTTSVWYYPGELQIIDIRNHVGPFIYCIERGHLYLLIEHYMVRKGVAESLQINVKGCRVDWLKTPQMFACKMRQRVSGQLLMLLHGWKKFVRM